MSLFTDNITAYEKNPKEFIKLLEPMGKNNKVIG